MLINIFPNDFISVLGEYFVNILIKNLGFAQLLRFWSIFPVGIEEFLREIPAYVYSNFFTFSETRRALHIAG